MNLPVDNDPIWKLLQISISAIITVLMFFIGYVTNQWKERKKENKRLNDVRYYFYICLLRFKIGLEKQIEIFGKSDSLFSEDLKNSVLISREVRRQIEVSPTQILSISKTDVFSFFVKNRLDKKNDRIKIFSLFYLLIEIIDTYNSNLEKTYLSYLDDYNKRLSVVEKHVGEALDLLLKSLHQKNAEGIMDSFYQELHMIYKKYCDIGDRTPDSIKAYLLMPFHKKCILFPKHPDSIKIMFLMQYTEAELEGLKFSKYDFSEHVRMWMEQYKGMLRVVNKMIDIEFSNMSLKVDIFEPKLNNNKA